MDRAHHRTAAQQTAAKQTAAKQTAAKRITRVFAGLAAAVGLAGFAQGSLAAEFPEPLAAEPIPAVASIATPYPPSYALVHDFGFGSLIDSAFSLVDTADGRFKGMVSAGNFATVVVSSARQEIYVGETYYSHGTRGERADLVSVYDMENLALLAEIPIPEKRAGIVVQKWAQAITASGKFMLIFNLTPATSVSVVDLDTRTFVGEIPTPGCSLVYPTKAHDFFMICGDGALLNVFLDDNGAVAAQRKTAPFIDIDADPLSEKATLAGGTWQFVSFLGDVQPVSADGAPGERWSLTSKQERGRNWRPAGWHWTAGHPDGRLWVGMTPNGYDGSHKDPATEIWLFDAKQHKRLQRIELKVPALSIDVTLEEQPRLLVVNVEFALDVYDAASGAHQRTIYDLGASPYQVHRMP
ncbi:MAG TPA: amine dehydrogenase large subunit [Pseudomonadales bacterium]